MASKLIRNIFFRTTQHQRPIVNLICLPYLLMATILFLYMDMPNL